MARQSRLDLPGVPQHVIQRGNNRQPCFLQEQDYRFYLESLLEASKQTGCRVHANVLMTNHVHLLRAKAMRAGNDAFPGGDRSGARPCCRHPGAWEAKENRATIGFGLAENEPDPELSEL